MSFLKIHDPSKRDLIVKEYLDMKKNIQRNNLEERVGKLDFQREMGEMFKPITQSQKEESEKQQKEIKELRKALPAIEYQTKQLAIEESNQLTNLGPIATNYLSKYVGKKSDGDSTYGIYTDKDNFYIGDTPITFKDDNIIVGEKEYIGTPGLWELIVSKEPQDYTQQDRENYSEILFNTNAIYQKNSPGGKVKSSKSYKWKNVIAPIWNEYKTLEKSPIVQSPEGSGLVSDVVELIKRFELLLASKAAGNTGVKDELNAIVNTLFKYKAITKNVYNKLLKLI